MIELQIVEFRLQIGKKQNVKGGMQLNLKSAISNLKIMSVF